MTESEISMHGYPFVRYERPTLPEHEVLRRAKKYHEWMDQRRTVRDFASDPIHPDIIRYLLMTASSAPSGAHKQPWTFCVVTDPVIKKQIREEAEKEEYESYHGRMSETWLEDLRPLQTDWHKPFLETAPCLVIVFKKAYDVDADGNKRNNYYVNESVGLATGFLLSAIHEAGLVALTHTPSPMNFLARILSRPENERPFVLITLGYPKVGTYVPKLRRKSLEEVAVFY
jgi:iodotyrosine deiodinase